ncbi:hypothetical protein EV361DRAFT_655452 [Lentinula raphanica]|nr:hypothetical protein EV361DRAFT_655452 [Lentinula raphanica]
MFPDIVFAPPSNSSKSHSRSKSKSSHVDVTMPMKTYDGSDNETAASSNARIGSVASSNTAKTPRASRAVKKGAKTPRSRSVSKSRTGSFDISEGDVDEHVAKPSKKTTTSTRSRSVSRAKSVTSLVDSDPGTGTEDEVALQRSTSGRSTGKAKQPGTRDGSTDDERSAVSKKKGSKARSQSKTRVSMIPEDVSDEDTVEPPPPKSTKKSIARKPSTRAATTSKSRTKQKVVDPDSAEIAELPTKATSAENSKSLTDSVAAAAALFDDDELENPVEERVSEPEPATNTRSSRTTRKATKPPSQNAPHPTTRKQIAPAKAESGKPLPKIESRTSEHIEERADNDIDAEIELHVPPITSSSVEPESDTRLESNARSSPPPREIGNLHKLSKTKQKTIRAQNETQFPEQHADHPPPVPPRSPSRPRTKQSPLSTDTDGDRQNPPELRSDGGEKRSLERPRIPSGSRAGTRDTSSAEPPLKQTVLPKPITMKKQGSFLSSRSSTQTRIGSSVDVVMDISSDEDDEDQVEAAIRLPETLPNQTKSRILPNSQAPSHAASTSTAMPTSTTTNQETLPFAKGTVQAKIAQIEKNVDPSCETNGRTSPYKSKLASNGSILESKPQIDGVKSSMLQDNDMQMAELSNPDNAGSEAKDESRKVSPLPRPAVTPPRSERRAPASPFKTPFRFGMGAANPFSVPPTPGAPLDILCGGPIPLSQELFVSTQELSETELNMTVEDWVRYHMRIEYAKFKEDGEREIDKFQKRAEQVRNTIEAL